MALILLHEHNHVFNNYSEYQDEIALFFDEEDIKNEMDKIWEKEQENSRKTEERFTIAQKHHLEKPYDDFFRILESNAEYIIKDKDEFLTESVSNEHFMKWLSHIYYNNDKSKFDKIIRENLKES